MINTPRRKTFRTKMKNTWDTVKKPFAKTAVMLSFIGMMAGGCGGPVVGFPIEDSGGNNTAGECVPKSKALACGTKQSKVISETKCSGSIEKDNHCKENLNASNTMELGHLKINFQMLCNSDSDNCAAFFIRDACGDFFYLLKASIKEDIPLGIRLDRALIFDTLSLSDNMIMPNDAEYPKVGLSFLIKSITQKNGQYVAEIEMATAACQYARDAYCLLTGKIPYKNGEGKENAEEGLGNKGLVFDGYEIRDNSEPSTLYDNFEAVLTDLNGNQIKSLGNLKTPAFFMDYKAERMSNQLDVIPVAVSWKCVSGNLSK